ncbi:unnamed protein product [Cylicocyclus nassatus]|uniref:Uncharacterized protein n=1 Tax=Cylicocyclus nassatus TaxID=53992 RepID=A0AA36DTG3_CYLNA|nr:unnamed protein product [Cylicocyclus nassatus]
MCYFVEQGTGGSYPNNKEKGYVFHATYYKGNLGTNHFDSAVNLAKYITTGPDGLRRFVKDGSNDYLRTCQQTLLIGGLMGTLAPTNAYE